MDVLYDLRDLLLDKIEEIVKKKDITPAEMEPTYKAVKAIQCIETIDAMENAEDNGYSYDSSYDRGGRGGNSYMRDTKNRYSRDNRRGRDGDNDGRYSERNMRMSNDYSGHTKEQMLQEIANMQRELERMN